MDKSLTRLKDILEKLAQDAKHADAANKTNKSHYYLQDQALFDEKLFPIVSSSYFAYVSFTQKRLAHLQKLIKLQQSQVADLMIKDLEEQVMALITAIKANDNLHNDCDYRLDRRKRLNKQKQQSVKLKKSVQAILLPSQQLYQKLSEYHGFERRLMDMVAQQQEQLNRCKADSQNSKNLQQELLNVHQRLGRCRKAISQVEKQIEDSEKSR